MNQAFSLENSIKKLEPLRSSLCKALKLRDKLAVLLDEESVQTYIQSFPDKDSLSCLSSELQLVLYSLAAIGQAEGIINRESLEKTEFSELKHLLEVLLEVERFYADIGGIVGYHLNMLTIICHHTKTTPIHQPGLKYSKPPGFDLHKDTGTVRHAVRLGIESLPEMAEMYPVGGAGDRLDLQDDNTGEPLPAALLLFEGRTLLEGLIRDLQAREYLYYKLFDKQVTTPIAMMTSNEKHNHQHILKICQDHNMFGRPIESFYFFIQPVVPVVTVEGNWSRSNALKLTLKPGGHGVIWKLAKDLGVFDWLANKNRHKALIRQINNPIAGTDNTLLALAGIGCGKQKAFGFASCDRLLNSAEGVNVLVEKKKPEGYEYCISNIEYTDMALRGIDEKPLEAGSVFSEFPANTNTLFADLRAVQSVLEINPIPGQLINMKHKVPYIDAEGQLKHIEGGRLESLMQNIADDIVDRFRHIASKKELENLATFITYNERKKTISTTKKLYQENESPISTPQAALYDRLQNYYELLSHDCGITLPKLPSLEEFLTSPPPFIVHMHPAVGPLYSIVAQKIRKGFFEQGSELQLEIAEADIENLYLDGSLLIDAVNVMGSSDAKGMLCYSQNTGKCVLHNIKVKNAGINANAPNIFWKNEVHRHEALIIRLHGNAEFYAENITFSGNYLIDVPDGYRLTAHQKQGSVTFQKEKIQMPSWTWSYAFDNEDHIILSKKSNTCPRIRSQLEI